MPVQMLPPVAMDTSWMGRIAPPEPPKAPRPIQAKRKVGRPAKAKLEPKTPLRNAAIPCLRCQGDKGGARVYCATCGPIVREERQVAYRKANRERRRTYFTRKKRESRAALALRRMEGR